MPVTSPANRILRALLGLALLGTAAAAQAGTLSELEVTDGRGGFGGTLATGDAFGCSATSLGDLDGDGVVDLAVGAKHDDDGGTDCGAIWILFASADGTIAREQKIAHATGGLGDVLRPGDRFGAALALLGDLDGDGFVEIAVGADGDDGGGVDRGAVWILELSASGLVRSTHRIGDGLGGLGAALADGDGFGGATEGLGDVDGDGVGDLAVGARFRDGGGPDRGAVWILLMRTDGTVRSELEIGEAAGGFTGMLDDSDHFGAGVAAIGDLDGDGRSELAVGAPGDDDGGAERGAVWILSLDDAASAVLSHHKISETGGAWGVGHLRDGDRFGGAVEALGDVDEDGRAELGVGATGDDDGGPDRGAQWVLFLGRDGTTRWKVKLGETAGALRATLEDGEALGSSAAGLGAADADRAMRMAVGARMADSSSADTGSIRILTVGAYPTLKAVQRISATAGGFDGSLDPGDMFGRSMAALGDIDGDGFQDVAMGAGEDDDGGLNRGAVYLLSLDSAGMVVEERKISDTSGGFPGTMEDEGWFGHCLAPLGDVDGDGVLDLAVGMPGNDGGMLDGHGGVWILFFDADGSLRDAQLIDEQEGGFTDVLKRRDYFGWATAALGDFDGDGTPDLAASAPYYDLDSFSSGAVWILFLHPDGTVKAQQRIDHATGGFDGPYTPVDGIGISLCAVGDVDGDGVTDLGVGASRIPGGGVLRGGLWILFLNPDGTVRDERQITDTAGGFHGALSDSGHLGEEIAFLGDLYGDGTSYIAVGAPTDDDGGIGAGAVWLFGLDADGVTARQQKISVTWGGFDEPLNHLQHCGQAVAAIPDLDGDLMPELLSGATLYGPGGAVFVMFPAWDGGAISRFRDDGQGRNRAGYDADPPRLGEEWTAVVDNTGTGNFVAGVAGFASPARRLLPLAGGFLLVNAADPAGELLSLPPAYGYGPVAFAAPVPADPALAGTVLYTQGFGIGGASGLTPHNARDLVIGTW